MVSLRKLEKELERQIAEKQRRLETKRKLTGDTQSISAATTRAELRGDGFTLEPVFVYLSRLYRLPKELLLARFEAVFGHAPDTRRVWLIEKLTRKFQREHYLKCRGSIPESVQRRDAEFERTTPPPPTEQDLAEDKETAKNFHLDPEVRLVAVVENPFERGRSWTIFQIVTLAGARGLSYNELALRLKRIVEMPTARAEKFARRMFTRWVSQGWLEVKLRTK